HPPSQRGCRHQAVLGEPERGPARSVSCGISPIWIVETHLQRVYSKISPPGWDALPARRLTQRSSSPRLSLKSNTRYHNIVISSILSSPPPSPCPAARPPPAPPIPRSRAEGATSSNDSLSALDNRASWTGNS